MYETQSICFEDKFSCISCGSKLAKVVCSVCDTRFGIKEKYDIYRCKECGMEQTIPTPSPTELKRYYEDYYNFGGEKDTLYTRLRGKVIFSNLYQTWLFFDGDISFHSKKGTGRLLDVGCNEGRGLNIYQRNGYKAEGLELNERAALEARRGGFQVYTDLLEEFQPKETYDVVVLSNVLEHSLQPKKMLGDVARILKHGGQVWISCPNVESWQLRLFGKHWINWHVPFHIVHFSRDTLSKMLWESGLKIQETRQESPALWMAQSLIARLFAQLGKPTKQLRSSFLIASLTLLIRGLLFPVLWFGSRFGRGDCLVVVAKRI